MINFKVGEYVFVGTPTYFWIGKIVDQSNTMLYLDNAVVVMDCATWDMVTAGVVNCINEAYRLPKDKIMGTSISMITHMFKWDAPLPVCDNDEKKKISKDKEVTNKRLTSVLKLVPTPSDAGLPAPSDNKNFVFKDWFGSFETAPEQVPHL
jgi:hypothetical protein